MPASMTDLSGQVALVTGATRGIGHATARELAACGATVVVSGRDEARAKSSAAAIAEVTGTEVDGIGLDVTDFSAVGQAVAAVVRARGHLDILVANAGIMVTAPLGAITGRQVRDTLDTNVAGVIAGVQAAGRAMMRRRTGVIVVVGSIVGRDGGAGQVAYSASKAAAAAVAVSAAKELGRFGVRVNAVAPGVIDTDLAARLPAEARQRYVAGSLLGRLGTPADVARVIRFLVSDDAAFITGQVLAVDGGLAL
jgi:3-oxoacyl-[acyl-carrier protein] reductase